MNDTTERAALHVIRLDLKRLASVTETMLDFVRMLGEGGSPPDPIVLRAMLYYIREYPEQFHHPMEDRFLFAALRSRTDDFDDVLDELQCEHIEGDVRLRNLEHALTRFELKGEAVLLGLRTLMEQYVDCLQVGARNMQNFSLLKEVGRSRLPVMLKRGMSATIKDLLMSAEYILSEGNLNVILCERGIRTFETYTRNTLDLNAIPVLKKETHLPVVVDPTHGIGLRDHVASMAIAAVAAGADALMVEVHNSPENARSDGEQALLPAEFADLMQRARAVAEAVGRAL